MTHRIHLALVASIALPISLVVLTFPTNEVSAQARAGAPGHAFVPLPPVARPPLFRPFAPRLRHLRAGNNFGGFFWPGYGDTGSGYPSYGAPVEGLPQAMSSDVRYTYTYDAPWDWVHRLPPNVVPSNKPYVSSCPEETVKVPGRDGAERTVNIMRCY
jgi:hypothetical protein